MFFESLDFAGKAPALLALHDADDLGKFGLIPFLPRRLARVALLFPVLHVEPLDVADAGRRPHLLLALDEDGLDVAAFGADGNGDLVKADAGVTGGILRKERHELVAARDALRDRAPPVVSEFDLALVEPDIVPTHFQVGLDAADELFVAIVAIAEENPEGGDGLFEGELVAAVLADVQAAFLAEHDILGRASWAVDGLVRHGGLG
jgi:hypothetical protein